MINNIKNIFYNLYDKLKNKLIGNIKPNILITNLNLSDRIYLSDLIYNNDGIYISYEKEDGSTTKFSEYVSTKEFKFIFYKQQFFMENSVYNFLDFSNNSKIQLIHINEIFFMINLNNLKSLKYSSIELESLLEIYKDNPVNINIVLFNHSNNSYQDQEKIFRFLKIKENSKKYNKFINSYLCDLSENYDELKIILKNSSNIISNENHETEHKLDLSEDKLFNKEK